MLRRYPRPPRPPASARKGTSLWDGPLSSIHSRVFKKLIYHLWTVPPDGVSAFLLDSRGLTAPRTSPLILRFEMKRVGSKRNPTVAGEPHAYPLRIFRFSVSQPALFNSRAAGSSPSDELCRCTTAAAQTEDPPMKLNNDSAGELKMRTSLA